MRPGPDADLPSSEPNPDAPRRRLTILALVLSILQLAVTLQLARDHLEVFEGGIAAGLFCGGTGRFDCSQVAAHESSWLLGFPVAFWGLLYAILNIGLATGGAIMRGQDRKAIFATGAMVCTLACGFDVYLGVVMITQIGHVCLNCVSTYVLNLLLAICYWRLDCGLRLPLSWRRLLPRWSALRDPRDATYYAEVVKTGLIAATAVCSALTLLSFTGAMHQIRDYGVREAQRFIRRMSGPPDIDMARLDRQPSVGPAQAPLTVALVGDFQCDYCRAIAQQLDRLRSQRPDSIRILFVNAPISSACNPSVDIIGHRDACWLAEVGECAAEQGKFWPYHDYLYERLSPAGVTRANVLGRLAEIGLDPVRIGDCLKEGAGATAVESDLALCRELGLTATPSVVINGYVKRGSFFPWMLRSVIAAVLDSSAARAASDVGTTMK